MTGYVEAEKKCPEHAREKMLLRKACKERRLDKFIYYVKKYNTKKSTIKKMKLLELASRWGSIRIVETLIDSKLEEMTDHHCSAIEMAIRYNHVNVFEYFVSVNRKLFSDWESIPKLKNDEHVDDYVDRKIKVLEMNNMRTIIFEKAAFAKNPYFSKYLVEKCGLDIGKWGYDHNTIYNFDKYNNYVQYLISINERIMLKAKNYDLDHVARAYKPLFRIYNDKWYSKTKYIFTKGLVLQLKAFLNGRIPGNYYLLTDIVETESREMELYGKVVKSTHYELFNMVISK